jgi:LemA protein
MLWFIWLLIGIFVFFVFVTFIYYNRFIILGNRIDNSLSQINVQLKRRAELIPNLIETVKGFAKHETAAIKAVTDARKSLVTAEGLDAKIKADKKLESALRGIFALAEGYPHLKADANFLELQKELAATEDKVAYARQYYNDSVMGYNNLCKTFPGNMFASMFGKKPEDYLEITEAEKKPVQVKF